MSLQSWSKCGQLHRSMNISILSKGEDAKDFESICVHIQLEILSGWLFLSSSKTPNITKDCFQSDWLIPHATEKRLRVLGGNKHQEEDSTMAGVAP